jgi:uncharacterized membrane protein (DUF4010 family)
MEPLTAATMSPDQILTRLGLALAIGFLIGVERGWREREEAEGERAAGLRTFALLGLSGGIWALLASSIGPVVFAAGFLAVAAAVGFFRWRESEHEGGFGATTLVAALLTFALGAYAVAGDMTAAAAAAVATAAILAAKGWLHGWLKTLTWEELRAALILAAMSFVALPVLPDRGFGPYEALNPRDLWLMTIAIAGVSFIGYIAVKVAGVRYGPLIAGVAGGLVSSTITTLDLARKARRAPETWRAQLGGALAASATMFARVAVVVAVFGPKLFASVVGPLAAALVVTTIAALALDALRPAMSVPAGKESAPLANPFEIKTVLAFGAMLAAVVLVSRVLTELFGGGGGVLLAAVAGLADVDAITLSMTRVGGGTITASAAEAAILTAVATNSLSKSVLAIIAGGRTFGLAYLGVSLSALVAGGLVALAEAWSF